MPIKRICVATFLKSIQNLPCMWVSQYVTIMSQRVHLGKHQHCECIGALDIGYPDNLPKKAWTSREAQRDWRWQTYLEAPRILIVSIQNGCTIPRKYLLITHIWEAPHLSVGCGWVCNGKTLVTVPSHISSLIPGPAYVASLRAVAAEPNNASLASSSHLLSTSFCVPKGLMQSHSEGLNTTNICDF